MAKGPAQPERLLLSKRVGGEVYQGHPPLFGPDAASEAAAATGTAECMAAR